MTTDIFIKTCKHDAEYHTLCLKSIEKFCTGFRKTVVVDGEHPRGYFQQQSVKMHADRSTDADMILVTDSDSLFIEHVTPDSFCRDGKPVWCVTPYNEEMHQHHGMQAWFNVMTKFFGQEPPYEFMRRQPFMFPRHVLLDLQAFCVKQHGRTLDQYIMESGAFSEWNVLGFFCWLFHRDEFCWLDTTIELPTLLVRQFWSHDPISKNQGEINQIFSKA